LGHVII